VFATEHLLGFAGVDFLREVVQPSREIVGNGLAGLGPLHQYGEIVRTAAERVAELLVVLEAAPALQELLRGGLVLPEVRVGDAFFYLREFVGGTGGVKDDSADRMRGGPNPDTGGAARLVGDS
jgi:hypothetical protein